MQSMLALDCDAQMQSVLIFGQLLVVMQLALALGVECTSIEQKRLRREEKGWERRMRDGLFACS